MNKNHVELVFEIAKFKFDIEDYQKKLNFEAVWLFVATLGTWSVSVEWVNTVSVLMVMLLFYFIIMRDEKNKKTYDERLGSLRVEVGKLDQKSDFAKARLRDIDEIKRERLSVSALYLKTPVFSICYVFWMITLVYSMKKLEVLINSLL